VRFRERWREIRAEHKKGDDMSEETPEPVVPDEAGESVESGESVPDPTPEPGTGPPVEPDGGQDGEAGETVQPADGGEASDGD
jgi:hypothetical protein